MKLKVWKKKYASEEDKKGILYARLRETRDGNITLQAVDKAGDLIEGGNILCLDLDGGIVVLKSGMSDEIPLRQDLAGSPLAYPQWQIRSLGRECGHTKEQHREKADEVAKHIRDLFETLEKKQKG